MCRTLMWVAVVATAVVVLADPARSTRGNGADRRYGDPDAVSKIETLSDAFRYSPSSHFAPGDGGVDLSWVDEKELDVVKVTNLASNGEGSLRWALEEKTGPRLVVFEVGGVIDLKKKTLTLRSGHGDVIIAGQTAPPPGITLIRDAFRIRAKNVIGQHIRVRPGTDIVGEEEKAAGEGHSVDALQPGGAYDKGGNQIIDHCSVTWGSDETISVVEKHAGRSYPSAVERHDLGPGKRPAVTISNTIMADGLRHSELHPENRHDKGSLLYRGFAHYMMGNLYANVQVRTPWVGAYGGCDAVVVNNLLHNIPHPHKTIMLEANGKMRVAIIGNAFSLETKGYHLDVVRSDDVTPKDLYIHDNERAGLRGLDAWNVVDSPPISLHGIEPMSSEEILGHHVRTVGARPVGRTALDRRQTQQVKEGEGEFIDSQEDVGGYPELEATSRPLDVPQEPEARGRWLYRHTKAVELSGAEVPE